MLSLQFPNACLKWLFINRLWAESLQVKRLTHLGLLGKMPENRLLIKVNEFF